MTTPPDLTQLSPDQLRHLAATLMTQVEEKEKALRHSEQVNQKLTYEMALLKRHAFGKRSEQLTVLQRLAAEDAATEAKEPKRKVSAAAGKKVVGALAVGATVAVSTALFGRDRLHAAPKQMVDGTGEERRNMVLDRGWCR